MRVVDGLEQLEPKRRVVALGTFDGVHLGHRRLIHEALERARELAATSTVATFEPMPSEILRPGQTPRRLSGIERRAELIAQEGVDELLVIAFTHELSLLTPEAFAEQVLVGRAVPCTSSWARTTASATPPPATSRRSRRWARSSASASPRSRS